MGSGLEDLHVSRVCLQRLPSQCCFKTLMTEANRTGFHLNPNLCFWIYPSAEMLSIWSPFLN